MLHKTRAGRPSAATRAEVVAAIAGVCLGMTLLVVLLVAMAEPTTRGSQPASAPVKPPLLVVPWIEVNPRDRESVRGALEGLELWSRGTDTAIASVAPVISDGAFFDVVKRRLPGLRIIPGIKTSGLLIPKGLDSVAAWREIGVVARDFCERTGSQSYLLENESAVHAYYSGQYNMNWERFREGLRELPREYTVIWYPTVGGKDEALDRAVKLCQAVQNECTVRFTDHASFFSPGVVGTPGTLNAVRPLEALAKSLPVPLIYCCGETFWPYDRVPEALGMVRSDTAIIYPGAKRWVQAAREITPLLILGKQPPASQPGQAKP